MNNPSSPKERNLVKGAIMRVFSRSELRRSVLNASIVKHSDPSRPKVKTWCKCNICGKLDAKSYMEVDHILPKVPLDSSLEEMTWDELIDNTWCSAINLQVCCLSCHDEKSAVERKLRKKFKDERKKK